MATLDHEDIKALTQCLRESATCHQCPLETIPLHNKHHETLDRWIANDIRRNERREAIKTKIGGWAIITVLGGIGTAVYHAALYLREHLK